MDDAQGLTRAMECAPDRPLATFAVLAFNQERFVREAIEGALSQTYEPLEIILSDDCSTDRTFEIMQEIARNYDGSHRLILNRNELNLGTLAHLICLARKAAGSIIVVAAGDDISLPHRTDHIVSKMLADTVWVYSSDCYNIMSGRIVDAPFDTMIIPRSNPSNVLASGTLTNIHGASAAYKRSFLSSLRITNRRVLVEDAPLSTLCQIMGGSAVFDHSRLIRYRFHNQNTSNRHVLPDCWRNEKAAIRTRSLRHDAYVWLLDEVDQRARKEPLDSYQNLDRKRLLKYIKVLAFMTHWPEMSMIKRVSYAGAFLNHSYLPAYLRRLFGIGAFKRFETFRPLIRPKPDDTVVNPS